MRSLYPSKRWMSLQRSLSLEEIRNLIGRYTWAIKTELPKKNGKPYWDIQWNRRKVIALNRRKTSWKPGRAMVSWRYYFYFISQRYWQSRTKVLYSIYQTNVHNLFGGFMNIEEKKDCYNQCRQINLWHILKKQSF